MHTQFCWSDGDTTPEGKEIEELSRVISETRNFEPHKNLTLF